MRGGVPREVDAVVAQALGDETLARAAPPIESPEAFAAALAPLRTAVEQAHPYGADTGPIGELETPPRHCLGTPRLVPARHWRRLTVIAVALLVLVALGVLVLPGSPGYQRFVAGAPAPDRNAVGDRATAADSDYSRRPPSLEGRDSHRGDQRVRPVRRARRPARLRGAESNRRQCRDQLANPDLPHADLGKLKPGVGLLVDLGKPQKVGSVVLRNWSASGTGLTLLDSNGSAAPTTDKEMTTAAQQTDAPAQLTLQLATPTTARYWVVWLTSLPAVSGGFRGGVAEVAFLH